MELKDIKRLVQLVESAQISHLSIEENGKKIEIKKEFTVAQAPVATAVSLPYPVAAPALPPASQPSATDSSQPQAPKANDPNLVTIKAQMVGTFYASPNPDSEPYVRVGDRIETGKVICIIEAMKLFNEIEAECSGVVEKVFVKNSTPIEYGQELFLVRIG